MALDHNTVPELFAYCPREMISPAVPSKGPPEPSQPTTDEDTMSHPNDRSPTPADLARTQTEFDKGFQCGTNDQDPDENASVEWKRGYLAGRVDRDNWTAYLKVHRPDKYLDMLARRRRLSGESGLITRRVIRRRR